MALPSPKIHASEPRSPGLSSQRLSMQETEVRPVRTKSPLPSPAKISPQKDYIMRTESPRPISRGGYNTEPRSPLGKGLPKPRPQSMYVDNDLEFLRSYDKQPFPLEKSHTGPSTPTSLPSSSSDIHHVDAELDLDYLRIKDEEQKSGLHRQVSENLHHENSKEHTDHGRRSSSSGPSNPKHSRQTSLGALSKGIMSGKFGEAFRKFEGGFSHHETKLSESRIRAEKTLAKVSPEEEAVTDEEGEDWRVETHDIPVKMKQHLSDTRRISAERDNSRPRTVIQGIPKYTPKPATTTNSRARMIQDRMNDYLNAQTKETPPPLTADGYGPYISDARAVRNPPDEEKEGRKGPGILPKPNVLRRPSLKGSVE
jgi:AP2-associated kinase